MKTEKKSGECVKGNKGRTCFKVKGLGSSPNGDSPLHEVFKLVCISLTHTK